jgi:hypothetical protein
VKRSKEEKAAERAAARRRRCVISEAMRNISTGRRLYVEVSKGRTRVAVFSGAA